MLGIDERALRIIWTVFLFGLLLAVVYFIRETILLFALSICFAYMLYPIVGFVERFIPKQRKNVALTLVYLALVGLIVLFAIQVIPTISAQATSLLKKLPGVAASTPIATVPLPGFLEPLRQQVLHLVTAQLSGLEAHAIPFLQQAGTRILSGVSTFLPMILIPILAFFFLKDGETIRVALIGAVDDRKDQSLMERITDDIHLLLRNYVRALVLLSVASFVAWLIFLTSMGYPYEVLLAGLAGILEFIPVIGPAAALAIMVVVTALSGTGGLLWIFVFWGLYRIFADYVLNPHLMSSGVELHPLLVLFGVLAGETVAGVPGMFFSVPVIAIVRVLYLNLKQDYASRRRQRVVGSRETTLIPDDGLEATSTIVK